MANDANIIKIKRSGTSGAPASLKLGELAYSYLTASGNPTSNGGDRLFIGANGVNGGTGNANDVIVIGGKYFTDMLDHERGKLTASSALIVDADKKLDDLLVGNLELTSNTLSASGNVTLKLQSGSTNIIELASGNYIAGGVYSGSQLILDSGISSLKQLRDGYVSLVVGTAGSATSTITFNNDGSLTVPGTIKTLSNADIELKPNGTGIVTVTTSGQADSFTVTDTGVNGANVRLVGNGATTPNKTIRSFNGNLEVVNSAYSTTILSLSDAGYLTVNKLTIGTGATSFSLPTAKTTTDGYYLKASTDGTTSWAAVSTTTLTNGSYTAVLNTDGTFQANAFLAAEGLPNGSGNAGYSFQSDGGFDTGMFSNGDGLVEFYSNNNEVANFSGSAWEFNVAVTIGDYTLPTADGMAGYVLTTNGDGTVTWAASVSTLSLKAGTHTGDTGSDASVNLLTDDIEIRGDGAAITTALSVVSGGGHSHYALEVAARYATTSLAGVATFNSNTFSVGVIGDVNVKSGGISNTQLANSSFYIGTTSVSLGATSASITSLAVDISGNAATATSATTASTADKVAHALTLGTNLSYATGSDFDGSAAREIDLSSNLTGITSISAASGNSVTLNNGTSNLVFDATGQLVLPKFTIPNTSGTAGQVLSWVGNAASSVLAWTTVSTSLTISDGTATDTVALLTDTLTFAGSGAITTAVTNNQVAISVATATSSVKGVATFNTASFSVSSGDVTIKSGGVSNAQLVNSTIYIGTTQVTLGDASGTTSSLAVNISGKASTAGTADKVANSLTFSDSGGVALNSTYDGSAAKTIDYSSVGAAPKAGSSDIVTVGTLTSGSIGAGFTAIANARLANSKVTVGTTDISLGSSSTTLAGLTQVDINNIRITGSTISSTDTDGDIVFDPNGAGTINVSSSRITNLSDPTGAQDAATKAYVDATRTGLDVKASVRAATTANITLSNTQTIDGVALAVDNRVLVKNQDTASENGLYVVKSGAWIRATDADNSPAGEVTSGMFTFVEQGTVNADSGWVLTTDGAITLDTTSLTFVQFSGAGQITAGDGLSKTGNRLDVNVANGIEISGDNVQLASSVAGNGLTYTSGVIDIVGTSGRISVSADAIDISTSYVGQSSITTLGTITSGTWHGNTITEGYGGTGQSTYAKGDLLYASASNTLSKLTAGTNGQTLQLQDGLPVWADLDGGTY